MSNTTVNYYDRTGTKIVRARTYSTAELAWAAIKRAQKAGKIAMLARARTAQDDPTCHH